MVVVMLVPLETRLEVELVGKLERVACSLKMSRWSIWEGPEAPNHKTRGLSRRVFPGQLLGPVTGPRHAPCSNPWILSHRPICVFFIIIIFSGAGSHWSNYPKHMGIYFSNHERLTPSQGYFEGPWALLASPFRRLPWPAAPREPLLPLWTTGARRGTRVCGHTRNQKA